MKKFDSRVFMASVRREAGENQADLPTLTEIRNLFALPREQFLAQAYRIFLHREPDPPGLAAYHERAGNLVGRLLILASFRFSPERVVLPCGLRRLLTSCATLLRRSGR